jgi:hypothetical protein
MSDGEELLKKASGLFSKLGTTLKETGKQVTGIGRGTVRVELDRTKAAPGDTLRGRVILALPEPVDARRLVVSLVASQRMIELRRQGRGSTPMSGRAEVFRVDNELAPARSYTSETQAFELLVPFDALEKRAAANAHPIADAVRSVASVLQPSEGPIEWIVVVALEIPWGRNLSHEVAVLIAR